MENTRYPHISLTAQQISSISGCSLRSAYYYLRGEIEWPAKIARQVEESLGVSRLHLLYPDEYDPDGRRLHGAQ